MTTVHYVDANLHHDLVTGRAVIAILHMVNGTPTDWYSKRQATVEAATYGSEFVASTLSMGHRQTGIPRDKQQWKLLHMDQNLWQQGLLLTKLLTSGTPLCT